MTVNDRQEPVETDRAVEGDPVLLAMAQALHAGPRDELFARMDFSDDQWARLEAAAAVVRAPLLEALAAAAPVVARQVENERYCLLAAIRKGQTSLAPDSPLDSAAEKADLAIRAVLPESAR